MNILITGATGLLGSALVNTRDQSDYITGLYLGRYPMDNQNNVKYYTLDMLDKDALGSLFQKNKIECVLHTAGIADVDYCESHYREARASNLGGTQNLADLCKANGARFIYISTNAVFDGRHAPYRETDEVNPQNKYGEIKLECEAIVKDSLTGYLIIRPILMYGWHNKYERKNLVTSLLEKLPKEESVNMVIDVYENPLFSHQCAQAVWSLLKKEKCGIYHIAGRDIVSRYEYALTIAEVFSLEKKLIRPVESSFFPDIAPRPRNTSYDVSKLQRDIGFMPLGLKDGLLIMKSMKGFSNAE